MITSARFTNISDSSIYLTSSITVPAGGQLDLLQGLPLADILNNSAILTAIRARNATMALSYDTGTATQGSFLMLASDNAVVKTLTTTTSGANVILSYPLALNSTCGMTVTIIGTGKTNVGVMHHYHREFRLMAWRDAGNVTADTPYNQTERKYPLSSALETSVGASGGNVQISVTGAASTVVNWVCRASAERV